VIFHSIPKTSLLKSIPVPCFEKMDKLVIIPTYNERENIVSILQAVLALAGDFHILVVDDSSPDQTAQLVRDLSNFFSRSFVFRRTKRKGGAWYGLYSRI